VAKPINFQVKTTPKGRKFTSLVPGKTRRLNPTKTLQSLDAVATRAQQVADAATTRIAKAEAVTNKAAAVASKRPSIVGAAAVKLPPKIVAKMQATTASLAQLKSKAKGLSDSAKALKDHAGKYKKTVDSALTRRKAGAANAQKVTQIHGFGFDDDRWAEIVGAIGWEEINEICDQDDIDFVSSLAAWGEIMGDEDMDFVGTFDPNNPGLNPDGSVMQPQPGDVPDSNNPGFLTPSGAADPKGQYASFYYGSGGGGTTPGASLASQLPGPPNYGAGDPPHLSGKQIVLPDGSTWPVPGIDFQPDPYPNGDDPTFYDCPTDDDLPLGAIVFDGSRTPDFQGLANYSVIFGVVPGAAAPKGGPNSGYSLHNDGWYLELKGTQPSTGYSGGHNYDKVRAPDSGMQAESRKNNWGPLMGNPKVYQPSTKSWQGGLHPWTEGLRFSPSGPNGPRWFWFFDKAPDWAVNAMLQSYLNDFIAQYKAAVVAGQTDYVNAQLQDKLDAQTAQQQARDQANLDFQLSQQQKQTDAQAAAAQQGIDQQSQQLMLQQQAMQQQAYQQQMQMAAQQAAMQQQAQQMQLDYFAQNPQAMFAPVDEAQPQQGYDPSGGGGYSPDTSDPYADAGGGGYGDPSGGDGFINWGDDPYAELPDASEQELMQDADANFPGLE
jgi:hypothetical protein